jgi:hypothetical protein
VRLRVSVSFCLRAGEVGGEGGVLVVVVVVVEKDIFGCWVVMIIRSVILCAGSTWLCSSGSKLMDLPENYRLTVKMAFQTSAGGR